MMGSRKPWWRVPAPPWALVTFVVLLAVMTTGYAPLPWFAFAGAMMTPVVGLFLLRGYPVVALALCTAASAVTALGIGEAVPPWSVALGVAIFLVSALVGRRMPRMRPAPAVFAAGLALTIPLGLADADAWWAGPLLLGVMVVLPWLLGRYLRQQAELLAVTAERARLQERTRIAYDMHDTLGHELSLLALHAGGLEIAVDLDERHRAVAAQLRAGAGTATERLAEIVTVLRADEPAPLSPSPHRIEYLVDRAAQAGVAVSLESHGPRDLPSTIDRAAHRVVQEALTNAVKHAPGAMVRVHLDTVDGATTVTVTNDIASGVRRSLGAHAGLAGLRERVRLIDGRLDAGPRGNTFEVKAWLPHRGTP